MPGREKTLLQVSARLLFAAWLFVGTASADDDAGALRARYKALLPALQENVFNAPLVVESEDRDSHVRGEVYGVLDRDFDTLRMALSIPAGWCELMPLHLNIKACSYRSLTADESVLTVFRGGKHYVPVSKAKRNDYILRARIVNTTYLNMQLSSDDSSEAEDDGPLDTSEYRLSVEAIPIDSARSFVHVRFSYQYGLMTRMLSAAYFSTVGRSKVGFSVVGRDSHGQPQFARGHAGALERTVMRLYLALQAMLESRSQPPPARVEWSARRWHALTERYRRQLHELDEDEYLDIKRRERADWSMQRRDSESAAPG